MTKDVSSGKTDIEGNSLKAYKGEAVTLAEKNPSDAYQNAENWGYYIASYCTEAGFSANFEHTKNKHDIESKVIGGVSPRKGDHWGGSYWIKHDGRGCVPHHLHDVNPIIRFNVDYDAVVYDLAAMPLSQSGTSSTTPIRAVVHVDKAIPMDGPHKCPKCQRGFMKRLDQYNHSINCRE